MVDEHGQFRSSRAHREAYRNGHDLIKVEEAVIEVEAQYQRFRHMTGQEPDYFEAHAIASENLLKALRIVAEHHHLPLNDMTPLDSVGTFRGKPIAACAMKSLDKDYDPFECLKEGVRNAREDMPNVFICHPGYIDDILLKSSSLTINRAKEVAMLCDPSVRAWLEEQNVSLIDYRDI